MSTSCIHPLSLADASQLESTLSISSPLALVKELVDNAIDAQATSIEVLISADTVEKIEVRDNGCGIHPNDFDSLGRRAHTSKLTSFNELKAVGGNSLGFRGISLFTATTLAEVTITTRAQDQPVATALRLRQGAGVASRQPKSAPFGSTITVDGLFSHFPVRKKSSIRNASRTISDIEKLMKSYALARTAVKLSFKILNNSSRWSYAPTPHTSLREAIIQVFGAELASQCIIKTWPVSEIQGENTEVEALKCRLQENGDARFIFEAVLPRPDADPMKVDEGSFFSVDSRPVSSARGTMKKLLSLFRSHLKQASKSSSAATFPKSPFIRVNFKCPPGSYDPNVEPLKDEVLFTDEQVLMDHFKDFLRETYYPVEHAPKADGRKEVGASNISSPDTSTTLDRGVTGIIEGLPRCEDSQENANTRGNEHTQRNLHTQEAGGSPNNRAVLSGQQMAALPGPPEGLPADPGKPETHHLLKTMTPAKYALEKREGPKQDQGAAKIATQWTIDMGSDLNGPDDYGRGDAVGRYTVESTNRETGDDTERSTNDILEDPAQCLNPWLIAKLAAPRNRDEPRPEQKLSPHLLSFPQYNNNNNNIEDINQEPPILEQPALKPEYLYVGQQKEFEDTNKEVEPCNSGSGSFHRIPSADIIAGTSPRRSQRYRNLQLQRPSTSSLGGVMERNASSARYFPRPARSPVLERGARTKECKFIVGFGTARRLQSQIASHNTKGSVQIRETQQAVKSTRGSDARARGNGPQGIPSVGNQETENYPPVVFLDEGSIRTDFPDDDPGTYMLRGKHSMITKPPSKRRRRRIRTPLPLPLESIPATERIHGLRLTVAIGLDRLQRLVELTSLTDDYVKSGCLSHGIEWSAEDGGMACLESKLKVLVTRLTRNCDVDLDIATLMKKYATEQE